MTKDEVLWGNIRFLLLLIFSVAAIYIILCRYILDVPTEDSSELINDINHSERIFVNPAYTYAAGAEHLE